jgi:hypothetical protein
MRTIRNLLLAPLLGGCFMAHRKSAQPSVPESSRAAPIRSCSDSTTVPRDSVCLLTHLVPDSRVPIRKPR